MNTSESMESSKHNTFMQTDVSAQSNTKEKKPTCIIILGMAGSGKTTFVQRFVSVLYKLRKPYVINLDPACKEVPYPANIGDILYFYCILIINVLLHF